MVVQNKIQGRRTQVERRESARNALLASAAELVAEQGVMQSSLAEIGMRAGYSRGLVNRHFGTKEALIDELATQCQENFTAEVTADPGQSGMELVCHSTDSYLAAFYNPTAFARAFLVMWGEGFPAASVRRVIEDADRRAKNGFIEFLGIGVRDGSIKAGVDEEAFAAALLGMLRGIAAISLVAPAEFNVKRMSDQCHFFIKAALEPAN